MEIEHVELTRDCIVIRIPAGDRVTLPRGTEAYITQALGGSFTVQVRSYGGLFRIAGTDADALGKEMPPEARVSQPASANLEEQVTAVLKTCFDPEIPVNVIDLGLIYDTRLTTQADGSARVDIKMTLTAPGCGMGASIAADAEVKLGAIDGVSAATVEIVWDPPWSPEMISEEGRMQLGFDVAR